MELHIIVAIILLQPNQGSRDKLLVKFCGHLDIFFYVLNIGHDCYPIQQKGSHPLKTQQNIQEMACPNRK
jgi:hypothetical protein